jgi:hypothetical protein
VAGGVPQDVQPHAFLDRIRVPNLDVGGQVLVRRVVEDAGLDGLADASAT